MDFTLSILIFIFFAVWMLGVAGIVKVKLDVNDD